MPGNPRWDTLRPELTWSHYRRLISVENETAPTQFIRDPFVLEFLDLKKQLMKKQTINPN